MTARRDVFERIATALERLAPPTPEPADWAAAPAFRWDGERADPVAKIDSVGLERLRGLDDKRDALMANLARLATGAASHDVLLWGARGMGKSALVRAAIQATQAAHPGQIALIQIPAGELPTVPKLIDALAGTDLAFLLFIDDLGFGASQVQDNLALRSVLDGGIVSRPSKIRLAVTSNRRAIIQRDSEEAAALHERDERDNALALADRFGLTLGFHPCDRVTYLEIVRAYTDPLDLAFDEEEALGWAISRGNRSGRSAYQYASELAGRAGLSLEKA